MKENYPRYISTNPTGEDLLDGKSQEKISKAIADHIFYIDSLPEGHKWTPNMPRVIGVEGKWGCGKSNVLNHLQFNDLLKEPKYKFFVYDAWANQEDLQRRTILEQITSYLIEHGLLTDKVKVRLQKADEKNNFHTVEEDVSWREKLDLLMAKRVKNITRSVTPLNMEFKLLMLTLAITPILITLMNALKNDVFNGWWHFGISVLVAFLPALVSGFIIWNNDYEFKNILRPYQQTSEDKTTHQVVNEAEPTIHEFATWMKEISVGLNDFKLVVVFDNMDRLPSDKVKKLWSAIHSIFSTESYKNIWCIIPYDFEHLSCAFGDQTDPQEKLAKCFIDKSFPVVYRVPDPVVIDYKEIFNKFFEHAFGKTVSKSEIDIINRCYRITYTRPNIRAIISYINRMVTLTRTYSDISIVSIAVFLLKEDEILKHPYAIRNNSTVEISTDEYILGDYFLNGFEKVITEDHNFQQEIAALVYGIAQERAYQLPMHHSLKKCFVENNDISLSSYISHPLFPSVLRDVVQKLDTTYYNTLSNKLAELDKVEVSDETKQALEYVWEFLANKYITKNVAVGAYTSFEQNVLSHNIGDKQKIVARTFCTNIIANKDVNGIELYKALDKLFNEPFAKQFSVAEVCPNTEVTPDRFVSYIVAAGKNYTEYPIYTDANKLNQYLSERLTSEDDFDVIKNLSNDDYYSVKEVVDNAKNTLLGEINDYKVAVRLLCIARIFYSKIEINTSKDYLLQLWQAASETIEFSVEPSKECKLLYTLLAIKYPGNLQNYALMCYKEVAEYALWFISTADIIKMSTEHYNDSALQCILTETVRTCTVDDMPVLNGGFVTKWNTIIYYNHNLTQSELYEFAEAWGYNELTDVESNSVMTSLLPDATWFEELVSSNSRIACALREKAVGAIKALPVGHIYNSTNLNPSNNYWYKLYESLLNADILNNPLGEQLLGVVVKALQLIAQGSYTITPIMKKLLGLAFNEFMVISSSVNEIRRNILMKKDNYCVTTSNFIHLHGWLEKSGISDDGNVVDSADNILAPVVDNTDCQKIIMDNRNIYEPIIKKSKDKSSALHSRLKAIVRSENDNDFKTFLNGVIQYEEVTKDNV